MHEVMELRADYPFESSDLLIVLATIEKHNETGTFLAANDRIWTIHFEQIFDSEALKDSPDPGKIGRRSRKLVQ